MTKTKGCYSSTQNPRTHVELQVVFGKILVFKLLGDAVCNKSPHVHVTEGQMKIKLSI